MKTKLTLLLLCFSSFLFVGFFSQKNKELRFEDTISFWDKDGVIEPHGTVQIECKYVINSLLIKVLIHDKDKLDTDKFYRRFDTIKGKKYFGNFRDKDGYDLLDFPITILDIPSSIDWKVFVYHIEQKKIKIPRELFDMIDSFYLSVNNDK